MHLIKINRGWVNNDIWYLFSQQILISMKCWLQQNFVEHEDNPATEHRAADLPVYLCCLCVQSAAVAPSHLHSIQ